MGLLRENGGLQIDYVDEEQRRGYLVRLGKTSGGCGSGCSC
jgi:hypothetical protein